MKLIGYIRVSTRQQAEKGSSVEAQEDKIRQYAELYEHELVEIIKDAGKSAKSLKRPGVQKALSLLKAGEAEGILVTKLDRLTRSNRDFCVLLEDYFTKGFSLVSVSEQLDTGSASGRLVTNILMVVAQWERESTGERTAAVQQYLKSQGRYTGGPVPYGQEVAEDGKHLVPCPAEQTTIEQAKELREADYSLRCISKILAARGFLSRKNKPFTPNVINSMIKQS